MLRNVLLSLVVSLALTGCAAWEPESLPVTVDMDESLTDEMRDAIFSAADILESVVGTQVLKPVEGNGRRIQRGRIHIQQAKLPAGSTEAVVGHAESTHWSCRITLSHADPYTVTHEVLHCFGVGHDVDDPTSLMSEYDDGGKAIHPHHVERLRELASKN